MIKNKVTYNIQNTADIFFIKTPKTSFNLRVLKYLSRIQIIILGISSFIIFTPRRRQPSSIQLAYTFFNSFPPIEFRAAQNLSQRSVRYDMSFPHSHGFCFRSVDFSKQTRFVSCWRFFPFSFPPCNTPEMRRYPMRRQ